ncbi:MAG: class I SAM-dependent methyltransferase [Deltaproteobacteria bacterium]|nr:class I SAM-dependent methyltransferase [Deltaproteobacteria bacterium]
MKEHWDLQYAQDGFAYGEAPNDFLAEVVGQLPPGRALFLAEGEGRNAVFLAGRGWEVTAMDLSEVGLGKARELAARRGTRLSTVQGDLATFELGNAQWDVMVAIWCHLPSALRREVNRRIVEALRPGGMFVMEAYTPEQLTYRTGGPPNADMLPTLAALRTELAPLRFLQAEEKVREIHEGRLHNGMSAVVQVLAVK